MTVDVADDVTLQVLEFNENGEQRSTCLNKRIFDGDLNHARVFYGTFFAFGFVIPLVAVSLLYGAMVRRLLTKNVGGGKQTESSRAKRRVTRLVIIVVVIFAACWLPMQVLVFVGVYDTATIKMHLFRRSYPGLTF